MHNFGINILLRINILRTFNVTLTNYLIKKYNVKISDAMMIIEDEWDYIEEEFFLESSVENIARDLVDIYMVA